MERLTKKDLNNIITELIEQKKELENKLQQAEAREEFEHLLTVGALEYANTSNKQLQQKEKQVNELHQKLETTTKEYISIRKELAKKQGIVRTRSVAGIDEYCNITDLFCNETDELSSSSKKIK